MQMKSLRTLPTKLKFQTVLLAPTFGNHSETHPDYWSQAWWIRLNRLPKRRVQAPERIRSVSKA